jgi:hypothetical protein
MSLHHGLNVRKTLCLTEVTSQKIPSALSITSVIIIRRKLREKGLKIPVFMRCKAV